MQFSFITRPYKKKHINTCMTTKAILIQALKLTYNNLKIYSGDRNGYKLKIERIKDKYVEYKTVKLSV